MKYILDERLMLCGWKKLPFALVDTLTKSTLFLRRAQFEFLFRFSGKEDLDPDTLSEREKIMLKEMLKGHMIHPAAEGETRDLFYKEYRGIYKKDVQWSITGKCNYRCKHCFQSAPEGVLGEPTKEQCFDIIRQLDECGIRRVSITGGEPLIRNDLFEIIDELKRRNLMLTALYSNGKLINQAFLEGLKKRGVFPSFQISFDGVGCHDWMRGVEGAEESALRAFRLIKENGFTAASAMCLCRENIGSIRETVKTLASVGCTALKFQCSMPQGEWSSQAEHYLSTEEVFQTYLDYLPQFKEDGCPMNIQMEGFFVYNKQDDSYFVSADKGFKEDVLNKMPPCGVINNSLYIGPNGAVTPCMSMCGAAIEKQFPNLFITPLEEILTESSYIELTEKRISYVLEHNEECRACEYKCRCCGGCRAMATGQSSGDYFGIDRMTCKMFKNGWVDKLYAVADTLFKRAGDHPEAKEC